MVAFPIGNYLLPDKLDLVVVAFVAPHSRDDDGQAERQAGPDFPRTCNELHRELVANSHRVDPALGDGTSPSLRPRTSTVGAVPTTYRPRRAPCTHCGDTVLIVEAQIGSLFGMKLRGVAPKVRLEHADPGPVDDVFDAVDDGCHRPPVTR